jgi:hypothetical protein
MRTAKRLAAEFANAGGALLGEYFSERELTAIEESGSTLFLLVATRGRVLKGVHCVLRKPSGEEESMFSLTIPDEERTKTTSREEVEEPAKNPETSAERGE